MSGSHLYISYRAHKFTVAPFLQVRIDGWVGGQQVVGLVTQNITCWHPAVLTADLSGDI